VWDERSHDSNRREAGSATAAKIITSELIAITKKLAGQWGMDPVLACAIVEQESGWDPFSIRPESESGFMSRYGAAYQKIVALSASKVDDRWIEFEDVFYCSYGLMQTMYPVIIETFPEQSGLLAYPTRLCDPEIGLPLGMRLFGKKLKQAGGNVTQALLFWNGGGNSYYPSQVTARMEKYK
jgi:soluble lytic murein transglycosylase-like protein